MLALHRADAGAAWHPGPMPHPAILASRPHATPCHPRQARPGRRLRLVLVLKGVLALKEVLALKGVLAPPRSVGSQRSVGS